MRRGLLRYLASASLVWAMCASLCSAAPFEKQFQLTNIVGTCEVKLPGRGIDSDKAVEGRKYPYGTVVKTDRNSSVVVTFSDGNECRIYARTSIEISEDATDSKLKILRLNDEGRARVILETGFQKNNRVRVETPSAVCGAVGCDFDTEYKVIASLRTSFIGCSEGEISVSGLYFSMTGITADEQLTVAQSPDGKFVRVKVVKGEMVLVIKVKGEEKSIILKTGDEVQIQVDVDRNHPDKLIVVFKIIHADRPNEPIIISTVVPRPQAPGIREWPSVTIVPPEPRSPTPVGRR